MACVWYSAWAWKRLLVKAVLAVFFDALTKITTRSSLQLSLFERHTVLQQDPEFCNKEIRDLISDTKDTFGELAFKTKQIENNLHTKPIQLIFTVFQKKQRTASVAGTQVSFYGKTITPAERQATRCDFVRTDCDREILISCRFMSIDKRMTQQMLQGKQITEMNSNNVLLYRSYLYTTEATNTGDVINFQGNHYIKFPRGYAVLRTQDGVQAEMLNASYDWLYYATCFDCRTYCHAQKELLRKSVWALKNLGPNPYECLCI